MKAECYFSVDVESAGPIPGKYSMLSIGACSIQAPSETFYAELKPISLNFVPEALKISGFDMQSLEKSGLEVAPTMKSFCSWVEKVTGRSKAVFVGFNATYDWQFVNWYLESYAGGNPFGFGGVDIKSYYMGLVGKSWSESSSSYLPHRFRPDVPQTHNALDDALAQASIFAKLLAAKPRYKNPKNQE